MLPPFARRLASAAALVALGSSFLVPAASAQKAFAGIAAKASAVTDSAQTALASFVDRLPDLIDFGLPSFAPAGAVRLYTHPKFGDLLHEDYFRLPVGARIKLNEELELNTELGGYFSHGFRDDVGQGLYQFVIGMRHEFFASQDIGWSYGLQWVTPLSRPPEHITDGLRHTLPSITVTKTLNTSCGLVGFATFGGDFLDHTSLPVDFRDNQLRDNSLILTLGLAREWRRMHVILRVFDANTSPVSRISQNAFGFRPALGIPLLRRSDGTPRATATFEGRAVWGPDGFENGVNTSIRVDFRYRPGHREK